MEPNPHATALITRNIRKGADGRALADAGAWVMKGKAESSKRIVVKNVHISLKT